MSIDLPKGRSKTANTIRNKMEQAKNANRKSIIKSGDGRSKLPKLSEFTSGTPRNKIPRYVNR